MNKYKLIALDIDGTLVRHNGELTTVVRDALVKAQKEYGMRVVLASGRPFPALCALAEALELERYSGYLMPYNGGQIYSARNLSSPIHAEALDDALLPKLYRLCNEAGVNILSYNESELLTEDPSCPYVQKEVGITGMPIRRLEHFVDEVPSARPKCLAVGPPERIETLEKMVKAELAGQLDAFRSNPNFLELVPLGVNKGKGLGTLIERLNLLREEVIAVGDNYNDVEMIQMAGLGVAMANAPEPIKTCADYVTKSNEEDGVAHLLCKHVFSAMEEVPYTVEQVNAIVPGTLMESLGIHCTAIAKGYVSGTMPVDSRTGQPLGIIHGGANLAFAETLAGYGSVVLLEEGEMQVGAQVSGNHISSALVGDTMRGQARILHKGKSTHLWSVEIYSEQSGKLIHTARVLNSILKKR